MEMVYGITMGKTATTHIHCLSHKNPRWPTCQNMNCQNPRWPMKTRSGRTQIYSWQ